MKYILIVLVMMVNSAFGVENQSFETPDGTNIVLSYSEDSKWILKDLLIAPGKLQVINLEKTFTTKGDLQRFKSQYIKKYSTFPRLKSLQHNLLVTSEVTSKVIWEVKNQWSLKYEDIFEDWVKNNFNKDFFVHYQIKTDCADVAYALRWIFARIHALPAAGTLAGSHILFTQDSMKAEWSQLSTHQDWHKDQRFLAALNYLMRHVYTGTLDIDGYPVEMSVDGFKVGTIHLSHGHTMIISKIDFTGNSSPLWKLSSTVPAMVRELHEEIMIDSSVPERPGAGYLRMRWPELINGKWTVREKAQMPHFSEEQFDQTFPGQDNNFTLALIKRLGIPFVPKNMVINATQGLTDQLNQRVGIVDRGYKFCLVNDCAEGTLNYEDHSTPSRDGKIKKKFHEIDTLVNNLSEFDQTLIQFWDDFQKNTKFQVLTKTFSYSKLRDFFEYKIPSYDPRDIPAERWALDDTSRFSSLRKKFDRKMTKRTKLIAESSKTCLQNQNCAAGNENWFKLNTFKMDEQIKTEIFHGYKYLVAWSSTFDHSQIIDQSYTQKFKHIPFFNSDPNLPAYFRNGLQLENYDTIDFGLAESVVELTHDLFILNNITIVDRNLIVQFEFVDVKSFLEVPSKNLVLLLKNSGEIQYLNLTNMQVTSVLQISGDGMWFTKLGEHNFYLQSFDTQNSQTVYSVFKLEHEYVGFIKEYSINEHNTPGGTIPVGVNFESSTKEAARFLSISEPGSKDLVIIPTKNGGLNEITLKANESLQGIYGNKMYIRTSQGELLVKDLTTQDECKFKPNTTDKWYEMIGENLFKTRDVDYNFEDIIQINNTCQRVKSFKLNNRWVSETKIHETIYLEVFGQGSGNQGKAEFLIYNPKLISLKHIKLGKDEFLFDKFEDRYSVYNIESSSMRILNSYEKDIFTDIRVDFGSSLTIHSSCGGVSTFDYIRDGHCSEADTRSLLDIFYHPSGVTNDYYQTHLNEHKEPMFSSLTQQSTNGGSQDSVLGTMNMNRMHTPTYFRFHATDGSVILVNRK